MGTVEAVGTTAIIESKPETTIACDQAIFTSIRTPMGEGYRIIAASRGLQPDERQMITRYSPSHGGMCVTAPEPSDQGPQPNYAAAAFYPLPGGRLCVSLSCFAGAEHTGRGGQRVYTHCVVFNEQEFVRCGYNAFHVIRAMEAAGMTRAILKPPNVLPDLQLEIRASTEAVRNLAIHPTLDSKRRGYILQRLLDDQSLVVDAEDNWLESTEVLLLGLPGPTRASVSFSAGLHFSIGRRHRLHLLHDKAGQIKRRVAGQPIECVDAHSTCETDMDASAWALFVERHWSAGDISALAWRTSRAFSDVSPAGRQRIGKLYNHFDEIPTTDTAELLTIVAEHVYPQDRNAEREIAEELVNEAQRHLLRRFAGQSWAEVKPHWSALVNMWKRSEQGAEFARAPIKQALQTAMRDAPLDAAGMALTIAGETQPTAGVSGLAGILDEVLTRLAAWVRQGNDIDRDHLRRLCDQWRRVRPDCSIVGQISQVCAGVTAD